MMKKTKWFTKQAASAAKLQEPIKDNAVSDYSTSFLQRNEIKTRKCVYISQQVHDVICKIVRVIADKDISVGGYIDSVLLHHLDEHKDEINDLYRKERNDLI
jgi:hypothetical protein